MTDLADFLLARIAEDEKVAKAATALGYGWDADGLAGDVYASGDDPQTGTVVAECGEHDDAEHIARWGPERVLAECEAKRRIIRAHNKWCDGTCGTAEEPSSVYPYHQAHWWSMLVMASIYSDHEDYDPSWRP